MKNILKQHQFWACLAVVGMVMAIITGHQMVSGSKSETAE